MINEAEGDNDGEAANEAVDKGIKEGEAVANKALNKIKDLENKTV